MDINTIAEILVTYHNGEQTLYKNKGLEKFRKDIIRSPSLGVPRNQIREVDDDSSGDERVTPTLPTKTVQVPRGGVVKRVNRQLQEDNVRPSANECTDDICPVPVSRQPSARIYEGGYHRTDLNYEPSNKGSAHDLAKQMIADAKRQGMNFS
jgi:hypothetical protein